MSRHSRAAFALALVALTACGGFPTRPELPPGSHPGSFTGASAGDMWLLVRSDRGALQSVLHGSYDHLAPLDVELGAEPAWPTRSFQAGGLPGRLLLLVGGFGDTPRAGLIDARGQVSSVDVSTVFPEVDDRGTLTLELRVEDGQAWLLASCCTGSEARTAQRLYRLEGDRFAERSVPAGVTGRLRLVAVLGGELWLSEGLDRGVALHRRATNGWVQLPPPPDHARMERHFVAGTGPDDARFGDAHWNGTEWSSHAHPLGDFVGFLSTGRGEAQVVFLGAEPRPSFPFDVPSSQSVVLSTSLATHDGFAPVVRKELLRVVSAAWPLGVPGRLGDGSLLFLPNGALVHVGVGDVP